MGKPLSQLNLILFLILAHQWTLLRHRARPRRYLFTTTREDLRHLPAEHPQQRQLGRLQDRHLDPGRPGRRGGLQADPARADHHNPRRGC